jgi:hypothetical protein
MKIAICLSGMMRNFELTFPRFKKYIIDIHNPDIFFSGYPNKQGIQYCKKKILDLYQPKNYIIQDYNDEIRKKICNNEQKYYVNKRLETPINNVFSQYYNIYKSDKLRQEYEINNSFKYDIVIRSRIDVYYFKSFSSEELSLASQGFVLIPDEWDFKVVHAKAVSDSFAMSNSINMSTYSNLYNKIDEYFNDGCLFHAETLIGYHIDKEKLNRVSINRHGWYKFENLDGIDIDRKTF